MKRCLRIKHNRNLTFYNSTTNRRTLQKDENYCSSPISLDSNFPVCANIQSLNDTVNKELNICPKTAKGLIRINKDKNKNKNKNISNLKNFKEIKSINENTKFNLSRIDTKISQLSSTTPIKNKPIYNKDEIFLKTYSNKYPENLEYNFIDSKNMTIQLSYSKKDNSEYLYNHSKLNEWEIILKQKSNVIKKQRAQISVFQSKIDKLLEVNSLLTEKINKLQSEIYQKSFSISIGNKLDLPDFLNEESISQKTIESYRSIICKKDIQIEHLKHENEKIKSENNYLTKYIKTNNIFKYIDINKSTIQLDKGANPEEISYMKVEKRASSLQNKSSQLIQKANLLKCSLKPKITEDLGMETKLNKVLSKIGSASTLKDMILESILGIKSLIQSDKLTIFFLNENFYNQISLLLPELYFIKMMMDKKWIMAISESESSFSTPDFQDYSEIKFGKKKYDFILKAIIDPNSSEIYGALQAEKNKLKKKKNDNNNINNYGFAGLDEIVLITISKFISQKIIEFDYIERLTKNKLNYVNGMGTISKLLEERTLLGLVKAMKELLPTYFGYEKVGVLIHNSKDTYSIEENEVYSKYKTDKGITGNVLKSQNIIYSNLGKFDKDYCIEIDNITTVPFPNNFLFLPLISTKKTANAILQFMNKKGHQILPEDSVINKKEWASNFQRILGAIIETTNDINLAINSTIAFSSAVSCIIKLIKEKDERQYDNKTEIGPTGFYNIMKQLENVSKILKNEFGIRNEEMTSILRKNYIKF